VNLLLLCRSFGDLQERQGALAWEFLGCHRSWGQGSTFCSFFAAHIQSIVSSTLVAKKLSKKSFTLHTHLDSWARDIFLARRFFDSSNLRYIQQTIGGVSMLRLTRGLYSPVLLKSEIFASRLKHQVREDSSGWWRRKRMNCAEKSAQASGHVYAFLVCDYFTLKYYRTQKHERCGGTTTCLESIVLLVSFQYMEHTHSFKSLM
jgi:hypothetical protein